MLDALQLGMIPLGFTNRPYTFRFTLDTDFGFTTQELTLDIPDLPFELAPLTRFARSLWPATVGSAAGRSVFCDLCTVVNWKADTGLMLTLPVGGVRGGSFLHPATRDNSAVFVLHTGHSDNYARRRIYVPGSPAVWFRDGIMTQEGRTGAYNVATTWYMAFKASALANPYRWLIAYPRVLESSDTNFFGVAFREPQFIRFPSHCAKPPEGASLDWP